MKSKQPLDFIMRQFHDTMEMLLDYERDRSFVPSPDQLVLFDHIHSQLEPFSLMAYVVYFRMEERARGIT
jgi:hypothetical protein